MLCNLSTTKNKVLKLVAVAGFFITSISMLYGAAHTTQPVALDKAKGAIYLSFLGDAWGLPHEFNFTPKGHVGLLSKKAFYKPGYYQDPWAVWIPSSQVADKEKGILSDDSFFKIYTMSDYLNYLKNHKKKVSDDKAFFDFISVRLASLKKDLSIPSSIKSAYRGHLVDWLHMVKQATCHRGAKNCKNMQKKSKDFAFKRSFFDPQKSVCFGLFMHLFHSLKYPYHSFDVVTSLDSSTGKLFSEYFAELMQKYAKSSTKKSFTEIIKGSFKKSLLVKEEKIKKLFDSAVVWAANNKQKSIQQASASLHIYRKTKLLKWVGTLSFDPAEFAFTIWAAALYADKNPIKGLQLISNSGGDTDTIASIYGGLLGAYWGYDKLMKQKQVASDVVAVQKFAQKHQLSVERLLAALGLSSTKNESRGFARMKKAALIQHKKTKSKGVWPSELLQLKKQKQGILYVDTRTSAEMNVSTIPGAVSLADFEKKWRESPKIIKAKKIAFYCTIGYRSGLAAKKYQDLGLDAVNLLGGVSSWAHDGRAFETKDKKKTKRVHTYSKSWNYLPESYESLSLPKPE